MRDGVTAPEVAWAPLRVPDLAVRPLNLILYIHLRNIDSIVHIQGIIQSLSITGNLCFKKS
jgi:hypothetical protein